MIFRPLAALLLSALPASAEEVQTSAGPLQITRMAEGLDEPWGLAFLPDGSLLVTERAGRLQRVTDGQAVAVAGLPDVVVQGQGGLLDVMLPRDFAETREVWLAYAAEAPGGVATAAGRGRLSEDGARLEGFETVFLGDGASGGRHFGARLVEAADGGIYLTTGDRGTGPGGMAAQDPNTSIGKVIRLGRDGSPQGATETATEGWRAGVFSLGHRNVQGATLDAEGRLLTVEHGAQGGDELNAPQAGRNYGWPVISYGVNYGGDAIGQGQEAEGMEQPLHYWDPSIAPSGLMVYSGALVPEWQGDIFFGSLNSDFLGRLDTDGTGPGGFAEERIAADQTGRVRDVREGPDGAIWFLSVGDGAVYRMAP
jgi:glucose/arabinose dehydrogenase